jgi:hypothetical protein
VAGQAEGDQQIHPVRPWAAVMDNHPAPIRTDAAPVPIPIEDALPVAAEVAEGVAVTPVAVPAESLAEDPGAARTEEGHLSRHRFDHKPVSL